MAEILMTYKEAVWKPVKCCPPFFISVHPPPTEKLRLSGSDLASQVPEHLVGWAAPWMSKVKKIRPLYHLLITDRWLTSQGQNVHLDAWINQAEYSS